MADFKQMQQEEFNIMKPKIMPCLLRGFFIGLALGGIITIARQYSNPLAVFPVIAFVAWIFTFIFTMKMSIQYNDKVIIIPSLMVKYSWENLIKTEYIKDSVKLTFATPSAVLRTVKISSIKYFCTDEFKMFLKQTTALPEDKLPDMTLIFETIQLPGMIKNGKVPSMTDQNNRMLFKRNSSTFEMHKYVYDILEKHRLLDEVTDYFANETDINEILISDDEGIKFVVGIGGK
ncbi:MAG: hypothetical protein FWG90_07080 [Oscillospiraceae bacterium]|nr:hypothetical protein [Oscillospiraceae bacterium]